MAPLAVPLGQNEHGYCPHCGSSLDGAPIWQALLDAHGSEAKADAYAASFGADRDHGKLCLAVAIIDRWDDRVVSYRCPTCEQSWPRSGKQAGVARA